MNTKNVLNSVPDIPGEVNMSELDITLVMESDQNVKKAEGYTKDLEDVSKLHVSLDYYYYYYYFVL